MLTVVEFPTVVHRLGARDITVLSEANFLSTRHENCRRRCVATSRLLRLSAPSDDGNAAMD